MTLGIDIGGTNLGLGLVEGEKLQKVVSVPSFRPHFTLEETLEYLSAQIESIITPETERIGIGVPSILDIKSGVVYDAINIPSWKEVPLKAYLEGRFHRPVAINNDANCYALGAYGTYPADDKPEGLVCITLGTGVGIGIVNEGKLFCGANCGAGELCCMPYLDGILEDCCSKKYFTSKGLDSKQCAEAAKAGDPKALAVFEEFGRHLGVLVCTVLYAYDPSHIAFGGGVARGFPLFQPYMEKYLRENFPYKGALDRLKISYLTDNDIPVIGAALL